MVFNEEQKAALEKGQYIHTSEVLDKGLAIIKRIQSGELRPLLSSIKIENEYIRGFFPTDQITIAARSGMGKTSRLLSYIDDFINPEINPSYHKKIILLFNSWEVSGWRNAVKLLSKAAKKTMSEILDYETRLREETITLLENLAHKYNDQPLFINDKSTTPMAWENNIRNIANKFKGYTIVNMTDHTRLVTPANHGTEEALITSLMNAGMRVKNQYECINIFLSQMNRNIETNARYRNPTGKIGQVLPEASDIFGADSVQQTSDVVIALHRPGYYGETHFTSGDEVFSTGLTDFTRKDDSLLIEKILKSRFGREGLVFIRHDLGINEFRDFTEEEKRQLIGAKTINIKL